MAVPSRAIQISGSWPGLFGLRRYCQSQRSRLASAASWPNTRRYSASTERLSSGLYRSISATPQAPASTYSMLLMSASWVTALSRSHRAIGAGSRRTVAVTCSSSRTMRRPAAAICARSRATRTFSSRSSSLTSPRRAALMNEFSWAGSLSVHGA